MDEKRFHQTNHSYKLIQKMKMKKFPKEVLHTLNPANNAVNITNQNIAQCATHGTEVPDKYKTQSTVTDIISSTTIKKICPNKETDLQITDNDYRNHISLMEHEKSEEVTVSDLFKHGEVETISSTGTFIDSIYHCIGHPNLTLLEDEALPHPGEIFESRDKFLEHMNNNARQWHFYIACEQIDFKSLTFIYRCANYGMQIKKSKKIVCPCTIKLKRIARDQALVVIFVCHHHDHPLTEENFLKMAHQNIFSHNLKQEIKDLLVLGVPSDVMKKYIFAKTGFDMSIKYFLDMRKTALENGREMTTHELKMMTAKRKELQTVYGGLFKKENSQISVNIETRERGPISEELALDKAPEMDRPETCLQNMISDEETLKSLQKLQESMQDHTESNPSPLQSQPDLQNRNSDICCYTEYKKPGVFINSIYHCTDHPDLTLLEDEALPQPGQIFESRDKFFEYMNSNARQWHFYIACETSESRSLKYTFRCANFKCKKNNISKGIRKRESQKTACPCSIKLKHIVSKEHPLVVTFVCHHHDHPLTEESFLKMPHGKHFSHTLKQEIKDLFFLGVPNKVMKKYVLSKTGYLMSHQYFDNMKRKAKGREMTPYELKMVTAKREELETLYGNLVIKKNTSQSSVKNTKNSTRKRRKKSPNSEELALDKAPEMGRLETCLQIMNHDEETLKSVQKLQESMQDGTECNQSPLQSHTNLWNSNVISPHDIQNSEKNTIIPMEVSMGEHSGGGDINFLQTETSQINLIDETTCVYDTKNYQDSDCDENNILEKFDKDYEGHSKHWNELSSNVKKKLGSISSNYTEAFSMKDIIFKENLELKNTLCQGDDISKLKQELSNLKEKLATITTERAKALSMKELFLKENLILKRILYHNEEICKYKKESLNLKKNLDTLYADYANAVSTKDLVHKENLELKSKLLQTTRENGCLEMKLFNDKLKLSKEIHQLKVRLAHVGNKLDTNESCVAKTELHVDMDNVRREKELVELEPVELEPLERLASHHKFLDACYLKAVDKLKNKKDLNKQIKYELDNSRIKEPIIPVGDRATKDKRTISSESYHEGHNSLEPDKLQLSKEIHQLKVRLAHVGNKLDTNESCVAKTELHVDMDYVRRENEKVELEPVELESLERLASNHKFLDACYLKAVDKLKNKKDFSKQNIYESDNSRIKEPIIPVGDRATEDIRTISSESYHEGHNSLEPDKLQLSKEIHQLKVRFAHVGNKLDTNESCVAKTELHVEMDYVRRENEKVELEPVELEPLERLASNHKFLDACYLKAVDKLKNKKDLSKQNIYESDNSRIKEPITPVGDRATKDKRTIEPDKGKTKESPCSNVDDDLIDAYGQSDSSVLLCEMENEIEILDSDSGASDMENYEIEVLESDFDL